MAPFAIWRVSLCAGLRARDPRAPAALGQTTY